MATSSTTSGGSAPSGPSNAAFASSSPYPFAAAPDIIRAHQKDAYFSGVLANQLTDLHRRLLGARSAHAWADHARNAADMLYLGLTTLIGNRTLGEEYCDLVQVESAPLLPFLTAAATATAVDRASPALSPSHDRLPTMARRASYIVLSILLPHVASRALPSVRAALRRRLEARLRTLAARAGRTATTGGKHGRASPVSSPSSSLEARIERYILEHLPVLTSGAPLQAATLAVFYFGGAYYSLSKRAVGLRYVFTRDVTKAGAGGGGGPGADRAGYEVLGVLLVVQLAVQAYLHARTVLAPAPVPSSSSPSSSLQQQQPSAASATTSIPLHSIAEEGEEGEEEYAEGEEDNSLFSTTRERIPHTLGVEVSLDHDHTYTSNNGLLLGSTAGGGGSSTVLDIPRATHTPTPAGGRPRYDLARSQVMGWIKGAQQRRCTLCLEELKDPAATSCGHVFCWACIGDWVREKPECPLCRREALVQHILPLRMAAAV